MKIGFSISIRGKLLNVLLLRKREKLRDMFKADEESYQKILIFLMSVFILLGLTSVFYYQNDLLLGSLESFNNDDVKYIRSAWTLLHVIIAHSGARINVV